MPILKPVRRDLIEALLSLVGFGIRANQLDEADEVLEALRVLSPKLKNIDDFLPYIAIKRGFVKDALQMYASKPLEESRWFAMMGMCLKLTGDPTWHWHASEALEKIDETSACAHELAKVLLGQTSASDIPADTPSANVSGAPSMQQIEDPSVAYMQYRTV